MAKQKSERSDIIQLDMNKSRDRAIRKALEVIAEKKLHRGKNKLGKINIAIHQDRKTESSTESEKSYPQRDSDKNEETIEEDEDE